MGLTDPDRQILDVIISKFNGGPVGVGTIATALSEEEETIEDVHEPYLIQIGFLERTPRGRVATPRAYEHMGFDADHKIKFDEPKTFAYRASIPDLVKYTKRETPQWLKNTGCVVKIGQ
jgi:hypothetical protein